jgi:phenylpropionate dioxygenase-like ring-hydroxylating dioxygenase large terminal subunit
MTEPLLREAHACLERGATLPPRCYADPALYELEEERIFRREWLPLCRADQLREPGDYLALDLAGEPLLAVRGRDGRLRVLSNVCRHRWMPLASGSGRASAFQCPYHLWSYALDGRLLGAPGMEGARCFDRGATRLPELRSEVWQGFLFVNLDGGAEPLAPRLGALDARLAHFALHEMSTLAALDYDSPWNWKVMLENAAESYHHMGPHAATLEPLLPALRSAVPPQQGEFLFWRNPTRDGSPLPTVFPALPALDAEERASLTLAAVPPFLLLALQPDQMVALLIQPDAVERHRVRWLMCAPETVRREPDFEAKLAASRQILDAVHREDMATCAAVQRGLAARLAAPGALSPLEDTLAHFGRWWLERMSRAWRRGRASIGAVRCAFALVLLARLMLLVLGSDRADAFVAWFLALASLAAIPLAWLAALSAQLGRRPAPRRAVSIALALVPAWLLLAVFWAAATVTWAFFLVAPATLCAVLGSAVVMGLFFASPAPRSAARWFGNVAAGLLVAVLLALAPSWLFAFFALTIPLFDFANAPAFATLLLHALGWIGAELASRAGPEPVGIGIGFGTLEIGMLMLAGS